MSKLRIAFILSLVVLAGVFISTIYFIPSGPTYTESKRTQIIEGENEWILQYDIINNETRDIEYTIHLTVDDAVSKDSIVVKQGKTYTYIHHIYPRELGEGQVVFTVYEEGKIAPIEEVTYHISY